MHFSTKFPILYQNHIEIFKSQKINENTNSTMCVRNQTCTQVEQN